MKEFFDMLKNFIKDISFLFKIKIKKRWIFLLSLSHIFSRVFKRKYKSSLDKILLLNK